MVVKIVEFHRPFSLSVSRPGKQGQGQVDQCRIQRIQGVLESEPVLRSQVLAPAEKKIEQLLETDFSRVVHEQYDYNLTTRVVF